MTTIAKRAIEDVIKSITQVAETGAAFQTLVHETAVQCLMLVRDESDYGPARDLMNAVPRGIRREALGTWFKKFSNRKLSFSLNDKTSLYVGHLAGERAVSDFDVEAANATTFADLTKEPLASTFDVEKLIKILQGKAGNTKVNADGSPKVTEAARALASKMLAAVYSGSLSSPKPAQAA